MYTHTHIYIYICIYTYHAHGAWFAVACKALFCSFLPAQLVRLEALCRAAAKTPYICRFCLNSQPTAFCLLIFGLTFRNCFCAKLSPAAAEIGRVRCAKACPFGCKFTWSDLNVIALHPQPPQTSPPWTDMDWLSEGARGVLSVPTYLLYYVRTYIHTIIAYIQ